MGWFLYMKKNRVGKIVADWKEYKDLKSKLKSAQNDAMGAYNKLIGEYNFDGPKEYNTCMRMVCVSGQYYMWRCRNFTPEGDEKKCTHAQCEKWNDNVRYYKSKNKYYGLKDECRNFWKNKFAYMK